jgi:hypothetical protein
VLRLTLSFLFFSFLFSLLSLLTLRSPLLVLSLLFALTVAKSLRVILRWISSAAALLGALQAKSTAEGESSSLTSVDQRAYLNAIQRKMRLL